jgi:hypothetical protein
MKKNLGKNVCMCACMYVCMYVCMCMTMISDFGIAQIVNETLSKNVCMY